ncbi:hypothetical protein GGI15_000128 [Coemansia interrupta]|uniref:Uncharacterized protein n=1 Tax=Coemansia interrupta TaxID=1126814 RepID=A0A9W8HNN1_9FUNG|nr:hypothetical protein GGI15_000128 [Coemansia interrupta]
MDTLYKKDPRGDIKDRLLASALESLIRCIELGGEHALVLSSGMNGAGFSGKSLSDRTFHNFEESVWAASKRIQLDFEGGDLATVDESAGAIKQRIEAWFSSGKIWKTLMMRVYEVSDDLIDNAILDRSFEAADLGMVHAAGRLNESIRGIAHDLASEIESVVETPTGDRYIDPALTKSAVNALRAIACQKDPVDPFVLARHVWHTRKQMIESDILENVPRYAHWSLSQFWAIHASAVTGTIAGIAYLDVPLQYAATGGLGVSLLAFVWLGRRWVQLQRTLYSDIDARANALRGTLLDAHKTALEAKLKTPILECISQVSRSDASSSMDGIVKPQDSSMSADIPVSEWRLRLDSANRLWR